MTSLGSGTWRRAGGAARRALVAAGRTDPGVQREVNEDRLLVDGARGVFVVIDGVGGQAAGGKAADVALSIVRERLERGRGPTADRIRGAIAAANNEIHRLAATRAEWAGMACVLTIAVVADGKLTFGHVGDTRLYRMRRGRLEKITSDHSPVGEREDAGEISESQAMRHPRRNEVYRDVGSERHDADDDDFIDSDELPFNPDEALLLCTDGLTDLVDSSSISRIIAECAGDPDAVVDALVAAANAAGGKDNVTAVYVEGERFASTGWSPVPTPRDVERAVVRRAGASYSESEQPNGAVRSANRSRGWLAFVALGAILLLSAIAAFVLARGPSRLPWLERPIATSAATAGPANLHIVQPGGSIADAMNDAAPESEILVEPGEYRERIVMKDRVRLVSRVARGATIRLPAATPDSAAVPAVLAAGLASAELVGFRIVGDSATPLAVGIRVENSALTILDVEVTGATRAAVEFSGHADAALVASDLGDNPGAAIVVSDGATPRIAHNVFARAGTSERAAGAFVMTGGAAPRFSGNVFLGLTPDSFVGFDSAARLALKNENWFVPVSEPRARRGPAPARAQRTK